MNRKPETLPGPYTRASPAPAPPHPECPQPPTWHSASDADILPSSPTSPPIRLPGGREGGNASCQSQTDRRKFLGHCPHLLPPHRVQTSLPLPGLLPPIPDSCQHHHQAPPDQRGAATWQAQGHLCCRVKEARCQRPDVSGSGTCQVARLDWEERGGYPEVDFPAPPNPPSLSCRPPPPQVTSGASPSPQASCEGHSRPAPDVVFSRPQDVTSRCWPESHPKKKRKFVFCCCRIF